MKITRKSHPNIFKAFDDIIADNVASTIIIKEIRKNLSKGFEVNDEKINVSDAEELLGKLSDEDREILTMGDQDEAKNRLVK